MPSGLTGGGKNMSAKGSGMEKWWIQQAREALDTFTVVRSQREGAWMMAEAFAGTGSRYQVYAVRASAWLEGGEWLLVVRHPWIAAYEKSPGSYTTVEYFWSKWGIPGRDVRETNGGDVYAVMKACSLLVPFTFPEPEEYGDA